MVVAREGRVEGGNGGHQGGRPTEGSVTLDRQVHRVGGQESYSC